MEKTPVVGSGDLEQKEHERVITPDQLIAEAGGRSVLIGEQHLNRINRDVILEIIRSAHEAGYRTLGVEVSPGGRYRPDGSLDRWGLEEELEYLRAHLYEDLPEEDPHSFMAKGEVRIRMNRHWEEQLALQLGWEIRALDPHYFNASRATGTRRKFRTGKRILGSQR